MGNVEMLVEEECYRPTLRYHATYDELPGRYYALRSENPFTPAFESTFADLTDKDHAWLRVSGTMYVGKNAGTVPTVVIHFEHDGGTYKYMAKDWEVPAGAHDTWVPFSVDYITPEVRSRQDKVKAYLWDQGGAPMRVDDLRIEVFEPK